MPKTHDQITAELIAKHFKQSALDVIPTDILIGIRHALRDAISVGTNMALVESASTPIEKEMAAEAVAFEYRLPPDTDTMKVKDKLYPWGWSYADATLQQEFRKFCRNEK